MCVMHQELEAANGGGRGAQLGSQFPGVAAPPTPLHPALASVLDATSMAALGVVSAAGAGLCLMGDIWDAAQLRSPWGESCV